MIFLHYIAGYSSFVFLNTNPNLKVYSFDLGGLEYTPTMAEKLAQLFPGRLEVHVIIVLRTSLILFFRMYGNLTYKT